jgi:hypothetical protein
MKFALKHAWDYYTQVLLELICETFPFVAPYYSTSDYINQAALKLNRDINLDPQPPIYAVLSDLRDFYFLSYDGTKFWWMTKIMIPHHPCMQFVKGMTQGMFHIVSSCHCHANSQLKSQTYCFLSCSMDTLICWWRWKSDPSGTGSKAM